jgi:hypothetical protein
VHKFLYQSYLYWLEALSLMKGLSGGILIIRKLESWLQASVSTLFDSIVRKSLTDLTRPIKI